jgi:hypothetical protein
MSNLPYFLSYKNSLKLHVLYYETLDAVSDIVKKIPRFELLEYDNELLLVICRLVEIKVSSKKVYKIDKKQLVVDIYANIFGKTNFDVKKKLRSDIQFLYDNKTIKGSNTFKKVAFYTIDYIKRRVF